MNLNLTNRNVWLGGALVALPFLLSGVGVGLFWGWLNPRARNWHEAFAPASLSNWFLVIIALAASIAAIWTLITLIAQTRATKTAADAANTSAEALMNSERAWIMVDVDDMNEGEVIFDRSKRMSMTHHEDGAETTNLKFHFNCRNQGRSPAWITQKHINFIIVDKIPEKLDFSKGHGFQYDLVSMIAGKIFPCFAELECMGRIRDGNFGLVFGMIRYRDIFRKDRYTTFCYRVLPTFYTFILETKYPAHNWND